MNALDYFGGFIWWLSDHAHDTDMFLVQSIVTCGALFWLLHRAWLTLWKPVPELISILGVEVPDPPEVSLAGIRADAVTLHWTRPGINKPVVKYLIQVNGVNVGDSSRQETAITVTGLKAGHFYNVRVIAVGNNNFQAGSRVIRLRTYGRDGRPELANSRLSNKISIDDLQSGAVIDSSDESAGRRSHGVVIEAATVTDGAQTMGREQSGGLLGARRNTGGRKHSPSTASDHPMPSPAVLGNFSNESMQQLTERFESIRSETEEAIAQSARDADEFKQQLAELVKERDEKRQALKEKEEASEKLKKEAHHSERSNRQAQNRKTLKEKALRDKQMERTKMQDDMLRWQKETLEMQRERDVWEGEKENLASVTTQKALQLRDTNRDQQNSIVAMEEEIRIKGLRLKELEEERQKLPGVEADEESKALDIAERQRDIQWDHKERDLMTRANSQAIVFRNLESDLQKAQAFYAQLTAGRQVGGQLMYNQGNSSGVDFDPTGQGRTKPRRSRQRKSRTNTISSPIAAYPILDSTFPSASAYNNMTTSPTFAPGPYFDMSADTGMMQLSDQNGMTEAEIKALTGGAPLSPTATSLLPSNIFLDDEPPSPLASRAFGPIFASLGPALYENNSHSPESSSRSASLVSSPQTSSQNLQTFPSIREPVTDSDRRSLSGAEFGVIGSPLGSSAQPSVPSKPFRDLFTFPRQRGKTMQDNGPALGSLKSGQSQSFPRQAEEGELAAIRNRRTSFSTGWSGLPFMKSGASDLIEGNGPAPARLVPARRRGFKMFGGSIDDPNAIFSERDPSSPRPASIASSDLPRPSTDSAPFGWPAADSGVLNRNSPLATNWSMSIPHPWSRNTSRRASIKHNSTTALSLGIASEEDEFLPPETLSQQSSGPPVGVIGSRPMSANNTSTPRLNPAAPTFKAMFSRSKTEKQEKTDKKLKGKSKEAADLNDELNNPNVNEISPSASRASRDTHSIHTEASMPESRDSLDRTISSTPSEFNPSATSVKEKETSFQKLLRKGSSSKFSIASFRAKDSSLFGGAKKGGASHSGDRSSNPGDFEESSEDALGRSVDSVTSSPQIATTSSGVTTPREGRMSMNWGRFGMLKKGGKERRESADIERERSEAEGTEDEERDA